MFLMKARTLFAQLKIAQSDDLVPCTIEEVQAIERELGLSLPEAYKEFLLWMGHGGGPFLRGADCFFDVLPQLIGWAARLLEENWFPNSLPDDAFVFLMHQGYQFLFLRVSEGDDPPVYRYLEGIDKTDFTPSYSSFSEFLVSEIEHTAEIIRATKR